MKMKHFKQFVSLLAATALCVLLPGVSTLTAHAAGPVTYYVKYVDANEGWCFQTGGWSDEEYNRDLYYMLQEINDGDIVVIDSNGSNEFASLDISKRISNLTITQNSHVAISAPGYDEVYALSGSTSAITGDVSLAHLYDDAGVTFHSNVNKLELIDTRAQSTGVATVAGTTGHALRRTDSGYIYYEAYNVMKGKLLIDGGFLVTDSAYYSTTPTASQEATAPSASTPNKPAASGEYDDVPKTGESNLIFWLSGIALLCLAGRKALKRS